MATQSSLPTLYEWLSAEPFALAMSSGFFSFFAHTGFLSALETRGLVPKSLSGSSAGALVGGAWASGLSTFDLAAELASLRRADFWDPGFGLGVLRGKAFETRLRAMLPNHEFDACRVPVTISVYDALRLSTRVCSSGDLPSAIVASCTVPGMFHPHKREGRYLLDGGIADRPGLLGVKPGTRTLFHHIESRSPWRAVPGMRESLGVPLRENMHTFVLENLPRSGPFRLDEGRRALDLARTSTLRALDQAIDTLAMTHTSVT